MREVIRSDMSVWFLVIAEWVILIVGVVAWEYALNRRIGG